MFIILFLETLVKVVGFKDVGYILHIDGTVSQICFEQNIDKFNFLNKKFID